MSKTGLWVYQMFPLPGVAFSDALLCIMNLGKDSRGRLISLLDERPSVEPLPDLAELGCFRIAR